MTRLRLVATSATGTEPPLVVAVASSYRFDTAPGAAIRCLAEAAARRGLATVTPLDTLPRQPHFDVYTGSSVSSPLLRETDMLLKQSHAVFFCITEYAEGLPAMVGNLLEWAIADGSLCGKRVGWINLANGTTRARAAHDALERALSYAGAEIVTRTELPLAAHKLTSTGRVADHAALESALESLRRLLPPSHRATDLSPTTGRNAHLTSSSPTPQRER